MRGRLMAAWLLMMALPLAACAQDAQRIYGGREEDRLLEIAEAGGGLFAAGTTASSDGDLSVRTREGETGWAMLIDESGARRWSYASGRYGMTRMTDPAPLGDGRYSLVLSDEEGLRCDWILLDQRGKLLARTEIGLSTFGLGAQDRIADALICSRSPAKIAVITKNGEDGSLGAYLLDESGAAETGGRFLAQGEGLAVSDGQGALAWIGAQSGAVTVTRPLKEMESASVRFAAFDVLRVTDALMQADGSIVCCGEAKTDGGAAGFAARVSREGEALFAHVFFAPQSAVCQTENGYAVCGAWEEGTAVAFLDEDGGLLGEAFAPVQDALDIAGISGGCALLTHTGERRQKQAAVTPVLMRENADVGLIDFPEKPETAPEAPELPAPDIPVGSGYLVCRGEKAGVRVTLMDDGGQAVWSTRIPIHTAADALEWLCAAWLEDGSVFLGGRYLTGEGDSMRQQGAIALLSGDGVLRRVEEVPGAGAVVGAELPAGGMVRLHISRSETPAVAADDRIDMTL